jgi:putative DNA primase/helicase
MDRKRKAPGAGGAKGPRKNEVRSENSRPAERRREAADENILLAAALDYAAKGLPVFPCREKKPLTKHGFKDATTEPDVIKRWWGRYPDAQIAIPTGEISGIAVLDLDVKNGKDGFACFPTWETLSPVMARTPSGGAHLYFRADAPAPHCSSDVIALGVDTRGEGGSIIVPPSPGYTWVNGHDLSDLPYWPWAISLPARDPNAAPGDNPEAHPALVAAALEVIPNDDVGWDEWTRIGLAIWAATSGSDEGFDTFDHWSSKSGKYNSQRTRKRWREFHRSPPDRIGAGTLIHLASEADPEWRKRFDARIEAELAAINAAAGSFEELHGDDQSSDLVDDLTAGNEGDGSQESDNRETPTAKDKPDEKPKPRAYELVRASDVVMRAKNWLWTGHLLRGALELTTGVPGLGKSQTQCSFVACATTGSVWPDGSMGAEPVNVIMVTAEDALEQEVIPRLRAANADLDRVHILKRIRRNKQNRMFLLSEDIETLADAIRDVGNVGMVTLDPITAYMGKINSHHATDVRGQLGPLAEMAERMQVAISAITHPPKASSQKAIDHFIGSQAFIAAGRIGHLCIEEIDEDQKPTGRVLFTNAKNNAHATMPTLAYKVQTIVVGQDPETRENIVPPYVVWSKEPVRITSDQAVAASQASGGRPGKLDEAKEFLEIVLANGPVPVKEIVEQAKAHGLSRDQLNRAKYEKLQSRIEVKKGGMKDGWLWELKPEPF